MNLENLPEELFDLIATKAFAELTIEQQLIVEPYLTPSEYDDQHQIIRQIQHTNDKLTFEERPIAQNLRRPLYLEVLTYRIPVYQIAAGLAILTACTFAMSGNQNLNSTNGFIQSNPGQSVSDGYYPDSLVFNL